MKNLILTANFEDLIVVLSGIGILFWVWVVGYLWWVGRRLEKRMDYLRKTIRENTYLGRLKMTVSIIPKNKHCFNLNVANGTWFCICNGPLSNLVERQTNNDPMDIDEETAEQCAHLIDQWSPPKGWFSDGEELSGKELFKEFFSLCDGFTTY